MTFAFGTIIPIVKDKFKNLNDMYSYRPITLLPVVSKIFEHMSNFCEERLITYLIVCSLALSQMLVTLMPFLLSEVLYHILIRGAALFIYQH
jgi:hypothetical protein